jgi:hypothetical protein
MTEKGTGGEIFVADDDPKIHEIPRGGRHLSINPRTIEDHRANIKKKPRCEKCG